MGTSSESRENDEREIAFEAGFVGVIAGETR